MTLAGTSGVDGRGAGVERVSGTVWPPLLVFASQRNDDLPIASAPGPDDVEGAEVTRSGGEPTRTDTGLETASCSCSHGISSELRSWSIRSSPCTLLPWPNRESGGGLLLVVFTVEDREPDGVERLLLPLPFRRRDLDLFPPLPPSSIRSTMEGGEGAENATGSGCPLVPSAAAFQSPSSPACSSFCGSSWR